MKLGYQVVANVNMVVAVLSRDAVDDEFEHSGVGLDFAEGDTY